MTTPPRPATGSPRPAGVPASAGAVVIGGGIVGCSVAFHLAQRGIDDVLLLEQAELTGGTTWHAAGLVGQLRSDVGMTRLVQYGAEMVPQLEEMTGLSTGWKQCGSITLARTSDRMVQLHRTAALAAAFGVEARMISPNEVAKVWGEVRTDDVLGAVRLPGDGKANPVDLTMSIAAAARMHGARLIEGVEVERVLTRDGGVVGVRTADGDIASDIVVNTAGMWARHLGKRDAVDIPLHAVEHMYVATSPFGVDPDLPVLRDTDGRIYLKEEVGGLVVGGFEPNAKPFGTHGIPKPFVFRLFGDDWDQFGVLMEEAIHRVPKLEQTGISTFVNGPESFTPDNQFILGEAPNIDRYFVAAGFNSTGIASGLGVGRALAEWIIAGEPDVDLHLVELQRFLPQHATDEFLCRRVTEVPELHYAVAYPHREFETSRDIIRSPLHERMAAQGARFGTRMLWERPIWFDPNTPAQPPTHTFGIPEWFDSAAREHRGVRQSLGLFDMSSLPHIALTGPDAQALLTNVCAADVSMEPGTTVYTPMLNQRGGFEADMTVTHVTDNEYLVIAGSGERTRCLAYLRRAAAARGHDVAITDMTEERATIGVMGPAARDVISNLIDADFSAEAFGYGRALVAEAYGTELLCLRTSYVGELGWELHIPFGGTTAVYDRLVELGRPHHMVHAGAYALDSLRLEVGMRAWGRELTPDVTPMEAGLLGVVRRTDETFIGAEAVAKQRESGVTQRILSVTAREPNVLLFGHEPLRRNGTIVGWTTSGAYGHMLDRAVAFALVKIGDGVFDTMFLEDASFTVQVGDREVDVTVSEKRPLSPQWRQEQTGVGR